MSEIIEQARVMRVLITQMAQYAPDGEAVKHPELYGRWHGDGLAIIEGHKYRWGDKLAKARSSHTSQPNWAPDLAPSLWEIIDEAHAGTREDPIPAERNMAYHAGKYYLEEGKVYRCTRDTGTPVSHLPSELVGIYFETADEPGPSGWDEQ